MFFLSVTRNVFFSHHFLLQNHDFGQIHLLSKTFMSFFKVVVLFCLTNSSQKHNDVIFYGENNIFEYELICMDFQFIGCTSLLYKTSIFLFVRKRGSGVLFRLKILF